MARLQSLIQQHALERAAQPTPSRYVAGMSGSFEGVPKMHPIKSSMPVLKAGSLIHGLRIKRASTLRAPRLPKMSTGIRQMRLP